MANSIGQTKKAKYTKKTGTAGVYDVYHFETDSDQVLLDRGVGDIPKGTKLQATLERIKNIADTGGQGAKDLATHVANKNNPHGVTKAQVDLGSVVNAGMDANPTSGSNNYVKSGGVYTAVTEAKTAASNAQNKADAAYDLASGRSRAFVFSSINGLIQGVLLDSSTISGYKVGDSIYIVDKNVADFWISAIGTTGTVSTTTVIQNAKAGASVVVKWGTSYITLTAVENKEDLSNYSTTAEIAKTYRTITDSYTKKEVNDKIAKAKEAQDNHFHADIDIPWGNTSKPLNLFDEDLDMLYAGYDIGRVELDNMPQWNDENSIKFWSLTVAPGQGSDDNIAILMHECEFTGGLGWIGTAVLTLHYNDEAYTFQITATARPESFADGLLSVTYVEIFVRLLTQNITPALRSATTKLTGDVSASFTNAGGTVTATLAETGVAEGTYSAVKVDKKGRVTAGALSYVFASSLDDSSLNNLAEGGIAIIG